MQIFNELYTGKHFSPPRCFAIDEHGSFTFGKAREAYMYSGGYLCGSGILDKGNCVYGEVEETYFCADSGYDADATLEGREGVL